MDIPEETLNQQLTRLQGLMGTAADLSLDGSMLAQRIEGDLMRVMNTAWLNCSDFVNRHETFMNQEMPMAAREAMDYAIGIEDGLAFLALWREKDFKTIKQKWPDAPPTIYVNENLIL